MNRPPFPDHISASSREAFAACPTKFWWSRMLRLVLNRVNAHIHFGKCFAKGIEAVRKNYYLETGDQYQALVAGVIALIAAWGEFPAEPDGPPSMQKKTLEACIACLIGYLQRWPVVDDMPPLMLSNGIAVETTLSAPIPDVQHPDGGPLNYLGLPDLIAMSESQLIDVCDEKTSGSLGHKWADKWRLRAQFYGYIWLARQNGINCQGIRVRGIAPMSYKVDLTEVELRPADWEIERWLWQLQRDCKRMLACYEEMQWDLNLGDSCTSYGGCEYLMLCTAPNPYEWVSPNYKVDDFDPYAERRE